MYDCVCVCVSFSFICMYMFKTDLPSLSKPEDK